MLAFSHNIMSPIRHVYARVFYKIKYVNVVPQKRTVAPTFPAVNLNPWSQIRLIILLRMYVRRDASFPHTEFLPLSRSGVKSRLKWSRVLKVKQQCYELRVRVFLRRLPVRWTNELVSVAKFEHFRVNLTVEIGPKLNNWKIQNYTITLASVDYQIDRFCSRSDKVLPLI